MQDDRVIDDRTFRIRALANLDAVGAGVDGRLHGGEVVRDDDGAGEDRRGAETRVEREDSNAANQWAEQWKPRGMGRPVEDR